MRWSAEVVERLAATREGRELEFKQGLPRPEKLARTLCAFANTGGGVLLVGVGDRGELLGLPRAHDKARALLEVARAGIAPAVSVDHEVVEVEGLPILCCWVPLSASRPHRVLRAGEEPETVVRVGASNRRAQGATLRALLAGQAARRSPDALERRILDWIAARRGAGPGEGATADRFAREHNIGRQRARRAFLRLERDGFLVAHGPGAGRSFGLARGRRRA